MKTATQVDHIDGDATNNARTNLQGLCPNCHSKKTASEGVAKNAPEGGPRGVRGGFDFPDWLPTPSIPVLLVCGPPASGKTTYVLEHAGEKDLVLDLDLIVQELSRKPLYRDKGKYLDQAWRIRNERLAALSADTEYERCWVVMTGASKRERRWWKKKLGATVLVIHPGIDRCIDQLHADPLRNEAMKQEQLNAIWKWEK